MKNVDKKILAESVLNFLKTNQEIHITGRQILKKFPDLKNGQNVREIINYLRVNSHPITSNSLGYKFETDMTQIFIYSNSLKNRIKSMIKAYEGLVKTINE